MPEREINAIDLCRKSPKPKSIRKLSDELCNEHNLSVIIPGEERGKKYNEWQADKNSAAWKTQIRKDINAAIKSSSTYEEFLLLMRAKGYEIKGETFGEDALKFISFRPLGKDRFVRGSIKALGEYTKERIKERIELKRERKTVIPKRDYADKSIPLKGLNIDKLKAEYQELTAQKKTLTATCKSCEKELKSLNRKLENLNQYLGRTEPPESTQEQPYRYNNPS